MLKLPCEIKAGNLRKKHSCTGNFLFGRMHCTACSVWLMQHTWHMCYLPWKVIVVIYVFREYMHVFTILHAQHIDVVAIHHSRWDTAALSCSLIAVCSSLPGLSVVSMSHGCMTALKLCTATIMEHSTPSCIYDSIKKLHKDNGLVCYAAPFFLLSISLSH